MNQVKSRLQFERFRDDERRLFNAFFAGEDYNTVIGLIQDPRKELTLHTLFDPSTKEMIFCLEATMYGTPTIACTYCKHFTPFVRLKEPKTYFNNDRLCEHMKQVLDAFYGKACVDLDLCFELYVNTVPTV